jgi:hypothetical protein
MTHFTPEEARELASVFEHNTSIVGAKKIYNALYSLAEQVEQSDKECQEQARLNGIGVERELALLSKIEQLTRERDGALQYLNRKTNLYRSALEDVEKATVELESVKAKLVPLTHERILQLAVWHLGERQVSNWGDAPLVNLVRAIEHDLGVRRVAS